MDYVGFLMLLAVSCFFSGSETALFSIGKVARARLERSHRAIDGLVSRLLSRPRDLLITVLLGNEITNIGLSIAGASIISHLFADRSIVAQALLSAATVVPLLLVAGEITPKTIAALKPEAVARVVARPLSAFASLTRPLQTLLRAVTNRAMRAFGGAQEAAPEAIDESEFRTLVDAGAREGVVEQQERELIHNVLDFGDLTVADVYRPLDRVSCLDERTPIEAALRLVAETRRSRIPVWRGDPKRIVGLVYAKDLLAIRWGAQAPRTIRSLLRRPVFTHPVKPADDLLDELRQRRLHMAIVVDEFGQATGICTMEDLLEELCGPITDVPRPGAVVS